jgi:uncharacterized surface protein with fasciclin (FAS1) repeats
MKKILFSIASLFTFVSIQAQTVVDVIVNSPNHNYLEAAVIQAGLADELSGAGPFTVFAPDDVAFEDLAAALGTDVNGLLQLPNLEDILLYHVLGTEVLSVDIVNGAIVEPLSLTNTLKLTAGSGGVYVNQASVTAPDIDGGNGTVHVIDAVMLPNETVIDIAIDNGFTSLYTAVSTAELLPALTNPLGTFTVFAPTNAAFDDLAAALGVDIQGLLDLPNLQDILLYHVLDIGVFADDVNNGAVLQPLSASNSLKFTLTNDGMAYANQAEITAFDIEASNGVVHVLDAVVLPFETVVDVAIENNFTSLTAAVVEARLLPALTDPFGTYTVFAPTNEAFDNLATALGTDINGLLANPNLANILLYHVIGDEGFSADLFDGQYIETLEGSAVVVSTIGNDVFINESQVVLVDLDVDNGVVHVIDEVLLPVELPATVVDIIVNSPDHTTLETAVIEAGLADDLSGEGPFTVFAPTDAAFAALPAGTIESLLADIPTLTNILLYHVAGANAFSSDLSDGQMVMTLEGSDVEVTINNDGVFINDAQVIIANLEADNGIVHVIDAVLTPPPATVVDIIVNSPDHTTLETAVIAAGLADDLSGDGPFTVFAPTDAAFAALPAGTVADLLNDIPALTNILTYHVVGAEAFSDELTDGQMIMTLEGSDVEVTINNDGVFINDAQVIVADIIADNGVVHVIDAVLIPAELPATVVDIIVNSPDHNTLEAAVIAAGLADDLSGTGPFTVFAPTDAAFAALPAGTIESLLADIPALTNILTYHVVGAEAFAADLSNGQMVMTLQGTDVNVTINNDGVFINDAQVIVADIEAENGVVHVIDAVLLPGSVGIANVEATNFEIYPNPANEVINVRSEVAMNEIRVLDINGRTVTTIALNGESVSKVDVSELNAGIYMLEIRTAEGSSFRKVSIN